MAVNTTGLTHSLVAAKESAALAIQARCLGWIAVPRNGLGHPLHAAWTPHSAVPNCVSLCTMGPSTALKCQIANITNQVTVRVDRRPELIITKNPYHYGYCVPVLLTAVPYAP